MNGKPVKDSNRNTFAVKCALIFLDILKFLFCVCLYGLFPSIFGFNVIHFL